MFISGPTGPLRLFQVLAATTLFLGAFPNLLADDKAATRDLVILNWSEYLDPELIAKFERLHNANIREVYFETDDLRDDILLETDGEGFDLVMVNGINLDLYRKRGWLAPIDKDKVPNLRHLKPRWAQAFDAAEDYGVPYFWGTMGIGYRSDLVDRAPDSWMDLFRPAAAVSGKVAMIGHSRDGIGMALKALGHSVNSTEAHHLDQAAELLQAQRPHVHSYSYVALNETSALVSGGVVMTMMYSGDALMVQEHHEAIQYVVPKEGGNLWVDYLAVLQDSTQKELAWAFLDFINEPEHAAQLAEYVYYATPNSAAEALLSEEFLQDPVVYPDAETLARCEFYAPLPPRHLKKRNTVFSNIMR